MVKKKATKKAVTKAANATAQPLHALRQLQVIHLSDMHFGAFHQFEPEIGPDGKPLKGDGVRTLAQKLLEDLETQLPLSEEGAYVEETEIRYNCPVIACLTGDFAETGAYEEFKKATTFVKELSTCHHLAPGGMKRVFTVPGNHDVLYDKTEIPERWQPYTSFHNDIHKENVSNKEPWTLDGVHYRNDLGALILCINSAIYVEKDQPDEQRGQLTEQQLSQIKKMLKKVPKAKLESSIRIALVHHHPVLVPALVEADRNYDAIQRSGRLLNILHEYGFHLLLHGHKHLPLTFPEDMRNAFEVTRDHPMLIVAGGSCGSKGVPSHGLNTYNLITVKWHKDAGQTRIRIVTRGLVTRNSKNQLMLSEDWKWKTLREDDRSFSLKDFIVRPKRFAMSTVRPSKAYDASRDKTYRDCRRNMAVVEVRPSLRPEQAYEATFWIVPHKSTAPGYELPVKVEWSAGKLFPVLTVLKEDDPRFCAKFDYWGPMLVQAKMYFKNGKSATTFVYARVPGKEGA
jgi:3',5'-cyclic AMP phosphodiesterase CpdA